MPGEVACIAFNRQEADDWEIELTFPLPAGADALDVPTSILILSYIIYLCDRIWIFGGPPGLQDPGGATQVKAWMPIHALLPGN